MFEVEGARRQKWTEKATKQLKRKPKRKVVSLRQFLRIRDEKAPIPMRSVVKAYRSFKRKAQRSKANGKKMSHRDRGIYRQIVNHMIRNLPRSKRRRLMAPTQPKRKPRKHKKPNLTPNRRKTKRKKNNWRPNKRRSTRSKRAEMIVRVASQHVEATRHAHTLSFLEGADIGSAKEKGNLRRVARELLAEDSTLNNEDLADLICTYW